MDSLSLFLQTYWVSSPPSYRTVSSNRRSRPAFTITTKVPRLCSSTDATGPYQPSAAPAMMMKVQPRPKELIKDTHLFSPGKKLRHDIQKYVRSGGESCADTNTNKGHPLISPRQKAPPRYSGIRSKRRRVMCGDWSEMRLGQQVDILYC